MTKARMSKEEWVAQSKARLEAAQEMLQREVAEIVNGDDWRAYLDLQSKLHSYSPNNAMLLAPNVAAPLSHKLPVTFETAEQSASNPDCGSS